MQLLKAMAQSTFDGRAVVILLYLPKDRDEAVFRRWPMEMRTGKERLKGLEWGMGEIEGPRELVRETVEAIAEVIHLLPTWYKHRTHAGQSMGSWSGSHS